MKEFIPVCSPFLNGNEKKYVNDCIESGWISSSGSYVNKFEEAFAEYCGAKYAVAVCNGTVALHLALQCVGVGPGDEVIIPNFTMIATAFAVVYTGATPVFVDSDIDSWNIDEKLIEEKISSKTKAIMIVSLYGLPCNMDVINSIAKKHNLIVIEDAAESHGAEYNNVKTGSLTNITAFSFFANKNLTTGEGGMVVTNDKGLYDKARYYKNMCFPLDGNRNYIHNDIGFNYRMTNIHAAIGLAQVEKADFYRDRRIENANIYARELKDINGIMFQKNMYNALHVHWMNAIVLDPNVISKSRDYVMSKLKDANIDTRLLFVGMHKQPCLSKYSEVNEGEYPVSEWLTENGFYLPSASSLKESDIIEICTELKRILNN